MIKTVAIFGSFHHKNQWALLEGLRRRGIAVTNNIHESDYVYCPIFPTHLANMYPDKKFIYGPHFSVFPEKNSIIDNRYNNAIYIMPSEWCIDFWKEMKYSALPMYPCPFGVDTDKFAPEPTTLVPSTQVLPPPTQTKNNSIFVYFKRRQRIDLDYVLRLLPSLGYSDIQLFNYDRRYDENEYVRCLQKVKFGIWIGCHESQGFALQEALSCNVPLLVWDVSLMSQEAGYEDQYGDVKTKATSVPYWDDRCGSRFYHKDEFQEALKDFTLKEYNPRQFILENLTVDKCTENFLSLFTR